MTFVQFYIFTQESLTEAGLGASCIAQCFHFVVLYLRVECGFPAWFVSRYGRCLSGVAGLVFADRRLALIIPG